MRCWPAGDSWCYRPCLRADAPEDVVFFAKCFNAGLVSATRQDEQGRAWMISRSGRGCRMGFVPEGDSQQRLALQALKMRRYTTAEDALRALQPAR
jgi:hypothetical protein